MTGNHQPTTEIAEERTQIGLRATVEREPLAGTTTVTVEVPALDIRGRAGVPPAGANTPRDRIREALDNALYEAGFREMWLRVNRHELLDSLSEQVVDHIFPSTDEEGDE